MKKFHEFDTSPTEVPRVNLNANECSYIDIQITNALQRYMDSANAAERLKFRELPDLTKKIDHICWIWGQNTATYQESLDLKGLLVIRTLEDAVVRREPNGRDYTMPVMNPYWQQVDRNVYNHFSTYITDETARGITPYEALSADTPSTLCLLDDYVIMRVHDASNDMVNYSAIPLNPTPVAEQV